MMAKKKGFIAIERLSPPTGRGMGLHEMVAYSGTKDKPTGVLGHGRFRSGSGYEKLKNKLKRLIE
jgi:hypothetical protein